MKLKYSLILITILLQNIHLILSNDYKYPVIRFTKEEIEQYRKDFDVFNQPDFEENVFKYSIKVYKYDGINDLIKNTSAYQRLEHEINLFKRDDSKYFAKSNQNKNLNLENELKPELKNNNFLNYLSKLLKNQYENDDKYSKIEINHNFKDIPSKFCEFSNKIDKSK
jgi:hypothetical protein